MFVVCLFVCLFAGIRTVVFQHDNGSLPYLSEIEFDGWSKNEALFDAFEAAHSSAQNVSSQTQQLKD